MRRNFGLCTDGLREFTRRLKRWETTAETRVQHIHFGRVYYQIESYARIVRKQLRAQRCFGIQDFDWSHWECQNLDWEHFAMSWQSPSSISCSWVWIGFARRLWRSDMRIARQRSLDFAVSLRVGRLSNGVKSWNCVYVKKAICSKTTRVWRWFSEKKICSYCCLSPLNRSRMDGGRRITSIRCDVIWQWH